MSTRNSAKLGRDLDHISAAGHWTDARMHTSGHTGRTPAILRVPKQRRLRAASRARRPLSALV